MATSVPPSTQAQDEEDDYLTMTFDEPSTSKKHETLTQRKKRLAREAEERSRSSSKSKAQTAEEERSKRDAALSKSSLDTSSKGFKMMQKLGYQPGTALGVARPAKDTEANESGESVDDRLLEPVGLEMREGRGGIGADAEKKRKLREDVERFEGEQKKQKVEEGDFRDRQMKEREEKKIEGQMWSAMKVAERLEEEAEESTEYGKEGVIKSEQNRSLKSINVLWRQLVRDRMVRERDRRMRYDLHQSLSRLPTYEDPDEDVIDQIAVGRKERLYEVDLELDQDDEELEEFEALPVEERLSRLLEHLRSKWHYCFWCKFRYPDAQMEGCPGLTEDDHD